MNGKQFLEMLARLPARVWLFGACPVCGCVHEPVLVALAGSLPQDPAPDSEPAAPDDHPADCCPPLPYGPTPTAVPVAVAAAAGELRPEPDHPAAPVPSRSLIRPPRA